jgi:hypothetical protein
MRRPQHREHGTIRWQRNRPGNHGAGLFGRANDFISRFVDQPMIISFQFDANLLPYHGYAPNYLQLNKTMGIAFGLRP